MKNKLVLLYSFLAFVVVAAGLFVTFVLVYPETLASLGITDSKEEMVEPEKDIDSSMVIPELKEDMEREEEIGDFVERLEFALGEGYFYSPSTFEYFTEAGGVSPVSVLEGTPYKTANPDYEYKLISKDLEFFSNTDVNIGINLTNKNSGKKSSITLQELLGLPDNHNYENTDNLTYQYILPLFHEGDEIVVANVIEQPAIGLSGYQDIFKYNLETNEFKKQQVVEDSLSLIDFYGMNFEYRRDQYSRSFDGKNRFFTLKELFESENSSFLVYDFVEDTVEEIEVDKEVYYFVQSEIFFNDVRVNDAASHILYRNQNNRCDWYYTPNWFQQEGDSVKCEIEKENWYLFDVATGKALFEMPANNTDGTTNELYLVEDKLFIDRGNSEEFEIYDIATGTKDSIEIEFEGVDSSKRLKDVYLVR